MKLKTIYICSKCSAQSPKWGGQCLSCNAWNSIVEDVINVGKAAKSFNFQPVKPAVTMQNVQKKGTARRPPRLVIMRFALAVGGG